jgi:hypothetical protein
VAIFLVVLVLGFLLECRIVLWEIMLVIIVNAIFGALGHICLHSNGLRGTSAVFWGFGGAFLMVCMGDWRKKRSTQLEHLFSAIFAIYFATEASDAVKWTSHPRSCQSLFWIAWRHPSAAIDQFSCQLQRDCTKS